MHYKCLNYVMYYKVNVWKSGKDRGKTVRQPPEKEEISKKEIKEL